MATRSDAGWARQTAPAAPSARILAPSASAVAYFAEGYTIDSPCAFTREMFVYRSPSPRGCAHSPCPHREGERTFAQRIRALLRPKTPTRASPPPYVLYCDPELPPYEGYRLPPYRARE